MKKNINFEKTSNVWLVFHKDQNMKKFMFHSAHWSRVCIQTMANELKKDGCDIFVKRIKINFKEMFDSEQSKQQPDQSVHNSPDC